MEVTTKGEQMVTVYTTPSCTQCRMTKIELDKLGVSYAEVNLAEDAEAMDLVRSKGFQKAPVVNAGEDWWAGFQPDRIAVLQQVA